MSLTIEHSVDSSVDARILQPTEESGTVSRSVGRQHANHVPYIPGVTDGHQYFGYNASSVSL